MSDRYLNDTAEQVLGNIRRLREISVSYAREWPRLHERLQPILPSLSDDMQENVQRDMGLIQESILAADARLSKAASALLVAADAARGIVDLPAQTVCRLEMTVQTSAMVRPLKEDVVYLPACRHRPARNDLATINGQCRLAETENRALCRLLDDLEDGLDQLTDILEPAAAMDA